MFLREVIGPDESFSESKHNLEMEPACGGLVNKFEVNLADLAVSL